MRKTSAFSKKMVNAEVFAALSPYYQVQLGLISRQHLANFNRYQVRTLVHRGIPSQTIRKLIVSLDAFLMLPLLTLKTLTHLTVLNGNITQDNVAHFQVKLMWLKKIQCICLIIDIYAAFRIPESTVYLKLLNGQDKPCVVTLNQSLRCYDGLLSAVDNIDLCTELKVLRCERVLKVKLPPNLVELESDVIHKGTIFPDSLQILKGHFAECGTIDELPPSLKEWNFEHSCGHLPDWPVSLQSLHLSGAFTSLPMNLTCLRLST